MTGDRLILVGRVAGAFGVRGEVRITSFAAEPSALLRYRSLRDEAGAVALTLTGGRVAKGAVIARAQEVPSREAAETLKGLSLYVQREALPAPDEDEFYVADLIGLEVRDQTGAVLGRVRAVEDFGAGDLIEVEPPGAPSWWVAFTRDNAPEINVAGGYVVVVRPAEDEAPTPSDGGASGPPGRPKRPRRPRE
jgi:16S rRNA processing protein RimM